MNTNEVIKLGNIWGYDTKTTDFAGNVFDIFYISPTLLTMSGGVGNHILLRLLRLNKVIQFGNVTNQIVSTRGNPQRGRVYSQLGISPTIYNYGGVAIWSHIFYWLRNMNKVNIIGFVKDTGYKMRNAVYDKNGICTALMACDYKDPWKVLIVIKNERNK